MNNDGLAINDFPVKLNIRRGFYFEDFVKAFNKKWNIGKRNHKYCISFVGESGIDTGGVSREFYSGVTFLILLVIPFYLKIFAEETHIFLALVNKFFMFLIMMRTPN